MGSEIALLDEIRERRLEEKRGKMAGGRNGAIECIRKLAWNYHEPEPKRAEQRFPEGADVNAAAILIEPLHCRYGAPAEAVLAIVVILDNPCAVPVGDVEERQPLFKSHDRARRPLARRRQVDQSRWR